MKIEEEIVSTNFEDNYHKVVVNVTYTYGWLSNIFRFLNENVAEGKLYKLVNEKLETDRAHCIRLYEIVDGITSLPVVTPEIVAELRNCKK